MIGKGRKRGGLQTFYFKIRGVRGYSIFSTLSWMKVNECTLGLVEA